MGGTDLAHTRWATHGEPSATNAHPHVSMSGDLVLVQLIDFYYQQNGKDLVSAVCQALNDAIGAYAIAVVEKNNPSHLVAARQFSPLVVGVGMDMDNLDISKLSKGGFDHFMLKEINDQPNCLKDCMSGRLFADKEHHENNRIVLSALRDYRDRLVQAKHIIIVACGTSWHAGLIGKQLIEKMCRKRVEVAYASEFRYGAPVIEPEDVAIKYAIKPRRPGDIAICYCNPAKAKAELGWEAKYGIEEMCRDSWNWQKNNPNGYEK